MLPSLLSLRYHLSKYSRHCGPFDDFVRFFFFFWAKLTLVFLKCLEKIYSPYHRIRIKIFIRWCKCVPRQSVCSTWNRNEWLFFRILYAIFLYFTKRKPFKNYEKCSLFQLKVLFTLFYRHCLQTQIFTNFLFLFQNSKNLRES